MSSTDQDPRLQQVRRSALWAAYGDALGFMAEFTDRDGFRRRTKVERLERTVPWRRRVGGKFGPTLELPAGCLSDDTQLRLATCRSIRGDGSFDIEAFSSIELTVWPAYALGAGRGSLEAAAALRKRDVTWATNFFNTDRAAYLNGGGNGAAMRIQPHAWANDANEAQLLADVVTNGVATHGHPRGFVGAAFHALCLLHGFNNGAPPEPDDWIAIVKQLRTLPDIIAQDELLSEIWLGQWELRSDTDLAAAIDATLDEILEDLGRCGGLERADLAADFISAVEAVGAFEPEQRGSGTKTSVLAAVGAWLYADDPAASVRTAASHFGTDTDTIATMVGAIIGATTDQDPPGEIADRDYILREADRMWAISTGRRPASFPYPSIVSWTPPKSASDALLTSDHKALHVAGLGPAEAAGEIHATSGKTSGAWQWISLWFGQELLVKRRKHPNRLPQSQRVEPTAHYVQADLLASAPATSAASETPLSKREAVTWRSAPAGEPTERRVHEITDEVIRQGLDDQAIGAGLREVANHDRGVENATAYAAIIAKALLTRRDRDGRRRGA